MTKHAKSSAEPVAAPQSLNEPSVRTNALGISRVVQIENVFLASCNTSVRRASPIVEIEGEQRIHIELTTQSTCEDSKIIVFVVVKLTTGDESQIAILMEFTFVATYVIPEGLSFPQADIDAFGALNGVFNVWPFAREFVQNMSTRMGLPCLTIPVHRPHAKLPAISSQKTGSADPSQPIKTEKTNRSRKTKK